MARIKIKTTFKRADFYKLRFGDRFIWENEKLTDKKQIKKYFRDGTFFSSPGFIQSIPKNHHEVIKITNPHLIKFERLREN